MYIAEVCQKIVSKFPDATIPPVPEKFIRDPEPQVRVPAQKLKDVARFVKDNADLAFDLPIQMTAVDLIKENLFELVYNLYSTKKKHAVVLKVQIPRDKPEIDSVTPIWSGMDWQEREVFDLFGINFKGHPNMKRILMWDGYPGFPLRKDYVHVTDRFDSGVEVGTPGLNEKGLPASMSQPHGNANA